MFIEPIVASIAVATISLIGVFFFGSKGYLTGTHRFVLPVAVGIFLGVVFFELLPETFEASHEWGPVAVLFGFFAFYLLSYVLDTFHHHHFDNKDMCLTGGAKRLLIGDGVHNFADGIVIATAFMVDPVVGIITTIGIALHEIPQEIAEFGVLIHSGCTRAKAALYNFLSASTVIVGTVFTLVFAEFLGPYVFVLTGIAAGNLLYIAIADLLPELRKSHKEHFMQTFFATLFGAVLIAGIIAYSHEFMGDEHGHGHTAHSEEHGHSEHDEEHEDEHHDEHDDEHVD